MALIEQSSAVGARARLWGSALAVLVAMTVARQVWAQPLERVSNWTRHVDMDFTAQASDTTLAAVARDTGRQGPEPTAIVDSSASASADADEPAVDEPGAGEHAPAASDARVLELALGLQVLTRNGSFTNTLRQMPELNLSPTPVLHIQGTWYPGAHLTSFVLSNLGLELQGALMWPVVASGRPGTFETTNTELGVAARLRVPLAAHSLGVFAGYGMQRLDVARRSVAEANVPSLCYGFARLGIDARFVFNRALGLGVEAAVLPLTSFGEFSTAAWFPRASGVGLTAQLKADYELADGLELGVSAGIRRYAMSLHARDTDAIVVRSATMPLAFADQYLLGMLSLGWRR